jgi:RNA polymerase subunit RPABC4/transcription elongation factor Spt4
MIAPAVFGINNGTVNLVVGLLVLVVVVIWLALVYWTYRDAKLRIVDPTLVACATAASLFPFVGTLIYVIVRPPELIDDIRERDLDMLATQAKLSELGAYECPHCEALVEREFLRCPHCLRKLKDACSGCGKPLDPSWRICPYCETSVPGVTPPRRSRRRSQSSEPTAGSRPPADADAV